MAKVKISGLVSLVALSAALTTPAFAQDGDGAASNSEEAGAEQPSAGIGDIVVTAERRAQNIQNSSLSISVLDEEAIAQVSDARDIGLLVPAVEISVGANTLQTYVRGIGDFSSSALTQSAVAYNLDGVYVANTTEISTQFFDLQRVEVLKGPQGTLYGRNSSGGAINLIYNTPQLGEFSGEASAEVGNYDAYAITGAVNVPLGQIAALRVAGIWQQHDGYLSDGTDDEDMIAGRAQLLIEPSAGLSVRVAGSIAHRGGKGAGTVPITPDADFEDFTGVNNPALSALILANSGGLSFTAGAGLPPATMFTLTGDLHDEFVDNDQHEIHAEVIADLGFAELTIVPSYRWGRSSIGSYLTAGPFLNQELIKQTSFEARLAGSVGIVDYVLGGYYINLDQSTDAQIYQTLFVVVDQTVDLGTESYAPFGQITVNATDALRFIAGARYTVEDRSIDAFATNYAPLFGTADTFDFENAVTFKEWGWRAGIEYDVSPDNMIYATASKGFKSGGFNIFEPTPTVTNVYDPETLYSYVVGARNRFLDDTVQLNIEGFYWDYKDSQQNRLAVTPTGALQFMTFNAASATLYGVDADLVVQFTPNDIFTGSVSYLHTEFGEYVYDTPFPTDPATIGCDVENGGFTINCSGQPLPRAPKWAGMVGYQHIFDLGNGGTITAGGNLQFGASRYQGTQYIPIELAPAYGRLDAHISYENASGTLNVTAFVRNIEDDMIYRAANTHSGIAYAQVQPPRTFGVRVSTRF